MSGDAQAAKKRRLAEALRANLKRRKASIERPRDDHAGAVQGAAAPDAPTSNENKG